MNTLHMEQRLHVLQIEADGIAAILVAIDNAVSQGEYDENQTITAVTVLSKLAHDHANNIQAAIAYLDSGEGNTDG